MPDVSLNGIEFEVKGSSDAASDSINNLINNLGKLESALSSASKASKSVGALGKGAKAAAAPLSEAMREVISSADKVGVLSAKLDSLRDSLQMAFEAGNLDKAYAIQGQILSTKDALEKAKMAALKTAPALKEVGNEAKKAAKPLGDFAASLKRIAFYRVIRSVIKAITQAFKEGLQNAYQFSKGIGGDLAKSLDGIATKGLTMKNQLGAAFGGLLQAITPIIQAIIAVVTKLASALSMLFGMLGGTGKYLAAKDVWTEWGEAAAGAGGAAKEALKYLAPFDELNVLPDNKKGGGGGGSNIAPYGDMFTEETIGGWGDLAKNISQFIVDAFSSASEWVKDVDWVEFGRSIVRAISDFFTNFDYSGVASSIAEFLGRAIAALANLGYGILSELNNVCTKIIQHIVSELKKDRNGDGKVTADEILRNAIDLAISPVVWVKRNIVDPFWNGLTDGLKHPHGANAGANPTWSSPVEFLHDVIGLPTDQEIIDWVVQGINDIVNETVRFITGGSSAEDIVQAIETQWPLVEGWFKDLPAQFKNLGIKAINGLKQGIENGLNAVIDAINNSGIAQWAGVHFDPINIELTPELPESELHKNYNAAKAAIEADSQQDPVEMSITIPPPDEDGPLFTLTVSATANFTKVKDSLTNAQKTLAAKAEIASATVKDTVTAIITSKGKITSATVNSGVKPTITSTAGIVDAVTSASFVPPELPTTATVTDVAKNSDGSIQKDFDTPWMPVYAWAQKTYLKSDGSLSTEFDTPWMNTYAWVKSYSIADNLKRNGNLSVNTDAHIVSTSGGGSLTIHAQANGGVYSGGRWHDIARYASGGLPQGSQLFWARERGPELVGTLGGHTAVMNNDQIVASVSAGVARAISGIRFHMTGMPVAQQASEPERFDEEAMYRAFSRALADSDLGGDINLDGEPIYRNVVRRNRQNTRATGVNQLAMA